jgi:hypothetical protein
MEPDVFSIRAMSRLTCHSSDPPVQTAESGSVTCRYEYFVLRTPYSVSWYGDRSGTKHGILCGPLLVRFRH